MTRDEIREGVIKVVAERLVVPADDLHDDSRFKEDLAGDSLGLVDLVSGLEDEFGLTISDEEATHITTVGKAVDYVQKALQPETVSA